MTHSPTLVLGAITSLDPAHFEPFATSLDASGFNGRLAWVAGGYAASERRRLETMADVVVFVDDRYPPPPRPLLRTLRAIRETRGVRRCYANAFRAAARVGPALEFHLEGLQTLRYHHYRELLAGMPDVEQVLLSDVRDVVFQGDPFEPPCGELEIFLEDPSRTIAGEPFNRRWIRTLYGEAELARIGDCVVSCAGTVAGTRAGILRYLDAMIEAIGQPRRPMGNHDQGVHNHLLRSGAVDPAMIVGNGQGRVLTMGGMAGYERDHRGRVLNSDGTVPPIVHQYDRHPELAAELRRGA